MATNIQKSAVIVRLEISQWGGDKIDRSVSDEVANNKNASSCLLYTSPSPRDLSTSRMPSSA